MIYLSGCYRPDLWHSVGVMMTPRIRYSPSVLGLRWWAMDNGCFKHPERFRVDEFLRYLDGFRHYAPRCLFAVAPDRVGDAEATWEVARPVLPLLRERGWKAALVAQDGMERMDVDWSSFDCLFVGGSTDWKLGVVAAGLVGEAKRRGLWVHMGRVNSWKRIRYAASIGVDSCDGTCVAFGPKRFVAAHREWLERLRAAPYLPLFGEMQ